MLFAVSCSAFFHCCYFLQFISLLSFQQIWRYFPFSGEFAWLCVYPFIVCCLSAWEYECAWVRALRTEANAISRSYDYIAFRDSMCLTKSTDSKHSVSSLRAARIRSFSWVYFTYLCVMQFIFNEVFDGKRKSVKPNVFIYCLFVFSVQRILDVRGDGKYFEYL